MSVITRTRLAGSGRCITALLADDIYIWCHLTTSLASRAPGQPPSRPCWQGGQPAPAQVLACRGRAGWSRLAAFWGLAGDTGAQAAGGSMFVGQAGPGGVPPPVGAGAPCPETGSVGVWCLPVPAGHRQPLQAGLNPQLVGSQAQLATGFWCLGRNRVRPTGACIILYYVYYIYI